MTRSAQVIYSILGPTRKDVRPLSRATEEMIHLVFGERRSMSEIRLARDIYCPVGWQLGKEGGAVARSVQRLVHACWEEGDQTYLSAILAWPQPVREVKEMLLCLAFYCHLGVPYFTVLREQPGLLP